MCACLQDLDELLDRDGGSILIDRSQHGGMHAHIGGHDLRVNVRDEETGGVMALDGRTASQGREAHGSQESAEANGDAESERMAVGGN